VSRPIAVSRAARAFEYVRRVWHETPVASTKVAAVAAFGDMACLFA
jgi:hypothetical protein